MLKPSDSGGELTLYDVSREQVKIRRTGDTLIEAPDGKLYDLLNQTKVKRDYLKPKIQVIRLFSREGEIGTKWKLRKVRTVTQSEGL